MLLLRDPFRAGDQVSIADREGTLGNTTVCETWLPSHDGRRYVIPSAKVMTDAIEVEEHNGSGESGAARRRGRRP